MSILKFEHRTPRSLEEMCRYMLDWRKTGSEGVFGIGTNPIYAADEMKFIQRLYWMEGKLSHSYIQAIFSFDESFEVPMPLARKVCVEIGHALLIDRRQLLGAIHYKGKDASHVHCHYLVNYVGIEGEVYRQRYSVYHYMQSVNRILARYGLSLIDCNDLRLQNVG